MTDKCPQEAARAVHSASVVREGGILQAGDSVLRDLEKALYPLKKQL